MPRLGETVTEGVIVKWLKREGEEIKKDEPIAEISTDKVETDIPSPASGIFTRIKAKEGEKVAVGQVIGVIEESKKPPAEPKIVRTLAKVKPAKELPKEKPMGNVISPIVRKLGREKNIDLSQIRGSGAGGRITKNDVLKAAPKPQVPQEAKKTPLSVIRKTVAEHMIESQKTTAHVTAIVEADFSAIDKIRQDNKEEFKKTEGFSLTYMPFVAKAAITMLQKMPAFNAELQNDEIIYKPNINLGIAVAIDEGLIVPVIKKAESLSIRGLARAINDVATRARASKLKPDEVHEGTFTITNNGSFGSIIQTPIIFPGQVAILSLESIVNRVVALDDDTIAIRKRAYLPLTYDHRVIDGATASTFLVQLKKLIEESNEKL